MSQKKKSNIKYQNTLELISIDFEKWEKLCEYNQAYKFLANKDTIWCKDLLFYVMILGALSVMHFNLYPVLVIPFFGALILCASLIKGCLPNY